MPLFKKHHNDPVDNTFSGGTNDPNYTAPHPYSPDGPQGFNSSGVGAPIDSSYGNQTAPHHTGAATVGGTAVGAAAGHELGGHAGPGAAVGGVTGHHASHRDAAGYDQSTGYNQPATGLNQPTGCDQSTTGYGGQPGMNTTSHPVRNEVGGAALGAEAGRHVGGGHTGTGAAAGGLAGREHAHTGTGNVRNTTNTTGAGTAGSMSAKDAKILEIKGKAQQLAGLLVSSESMKAKGNAKEQQAAAIRHQQANISQAEAHEAQARLARERAGQGAYH